MCHNYDSGDTGLDNVSWLVSTPPDLDTATPPSEYGHGNDPDDLEQFSDGIGDVEGVNSEISCGSTSLTPSASEDEAVRGRRYRGFKKGRYPLPDDDLERRREETNRALILEFTVCCDCPACGRATRRKADSVFLDRAGDYLTPILANTHRRLLTLELGLVRLWAAAVLWKMVA